MFFKEEKQPDRDIFKYKNLQYISDMGLLDVFRGKKQGPVETSEPAAAAAGSSAGSEFSTETTFSSDFHPSSTGIDSTFASSGFGDAGAPSGERLYNPYEGISAALDRRDVKAPFKLPQEPEFLFSEEAVVQRRSWSENLTYYTGVGYLAGAAAGGGVGAYKVILNPSSIQGQTGLPSQRIRVNQLLNTSGKMGRSAGNALGVLGLLFSSSESFYYYMNDRILPEDLMTVAAGATTGAIYRSVRGPRQALAAGAVGSIGGILLLGARTFISAGL
jgi:import inner membrane translocase subunit TIM23